MYCLNMVEIRAQAYWNCSRAWRGLPYIGYIPNLRDLFDKIHDSMSFHNDNVDKRLNELNEFVADDKAPNNVGSAEISYINTPLPKQERTINVSAVG